MNTTQTTTARIVMRRVHTMHALRPLFSQTMFSCVVLALSLWGIGREVWVAHVLSNLSLVHTPEGLGAFLLSAFLNTRFIVQVLTILTGGAFVWLAYSMPRTIFSKQQFA